ncbi:GNAT family N-acetyltransferase [Nocardia sp. NPDC047038]|uniref:GNAT family N-acetyltransferase n=1 Tax=Nocardia sp. NPDC047038 TaxID=3154338 RepID=UPI0033D9212A
MSAIHTARLTLAAFDPDRDAVGLHRGFGDPEVMRWWNTPVCEDVAATRNQLAQSASGDGARIFTIRRTGEDDPLGIAGLLGGVGIPGLTWLLRRSSWGQGFAGEAAAAVIDHAFTEYDLERVEAWVEATNVRSLAVARRIGLTDRGRLSQRYPHRPQPHEVVVLGRSRERESQTVLNTELVVAVTDVAAAQRLLSSVLDAETRYAVGEPAVVVGMTLSPWSVGPRIRLIRSNEPPKSDVILTVEVGPAFEAVYARAVDAESSIIQEPAEQPWGTREFVFELPDGHRLVISAPA